jgi:hypothetical protein
MHCFCHALNNWFFREGKAYRIKFCFGVYVFQDSPRYVAAPLQAIRFANFQSARRERWILLGPPGCAQASPYLSPGLLDFLVV